MLLSPCRDSQTSGVRKSKKGHLELPIMLKLKWLLLEMLV